MTLKDRVENLEALHTVQKRGLANTQLWLVFVSFIMFLLVACCRYDIWLQQTTDANQRLANAIRACDRRAKTRQSATGRDDQQV